MKIAQNLADGAIIQEIGKRLNRRRLDMMLTQEMVAERSGVSKRTVERLEAGESTQLSNFIRILRSLELIHRMEEFLPEAKAGPMELLLNKGKERQRARTGSMEKKPWTWDEDV